MTDIPEYVIRAAAASMSASASNVPDLWKVPGCPDMTTAQLLVEFGRLAQNMPMEERIRAQFGVRHD